LERQLYPNPLTRFISRIINRIRNQRYSAASERIEGLDREKLSRTLIGLGLGDMDNKLRAGHDIEVQGLSVKHSYYVNPNERMELELTFGKGPDQLHELHAFKASLVTGNNPGERREYTFDRSMLVTAGQAYNLLSGRSLQLGYTDLQGEKGMKWVRLDFNNIDQEGNFKLREFNKSYGFDISKALDDIPMKEAGLEKRQSILESLSNGERVSVKITRGNKDEDVFLEANPQFKMVQVFDAANKKIRLEDLVRERVGLNQDGLKRAPDKKKTVNKQRL